jgi:CheY-like chemotaxis protein
MEPAMDMLRRRLILVADDNKDAADSLSLLLKLVGFDVETVHDGYDALAVAKDTRPDVILLDIGLPGLDGFQVAEELRSDERFKFSLLIAASGYSPDMFRDRPDQRLFDRYFVKPLDFGTLLPLLCATL